MKSLTISLVRGRVVCGETHKQLETKNIQNSNFHAYEANLCTVRSMEVLTLSAMGTELCPIQINDLLKHSLKLDFKNLLTIEDIPTWDRQTGRKVKSHETYGIDVLRTVVKYRKVWGFFFFVFSFFKGNITGKRLSKDEALIWLTRMSRVIIVYIIQNKTKRALEGIGTLKQQGITQHLTTGD